MDALDLFFDETANLVTTQRNLPHWQQEGKVHFVTWRQADSLPQVKLDELRHDRAAWVGRFGDKEVKDLTSVQRREYYRLFHERVEVWLDAGSGSCALKLDGPRQLVTDALRYFDGTRYALGSFAIAANHVHVLVVPVVGVGLSEITHSWKSFTAKAINKVLGRSGTFWQDESFDHLVRNEASLIRIEKYIVAHTRLGAKVEYRPML
ncbi:MAG: transposase [Flavobacteriales bacterium]